MIIGWLTDRLIDQFLDWPTDCRWTIHWFVNRLSDDQLIHRSTDSLFVGASIHGASALSGTRRCPTPSWRRRPTRSQAPPSTRPSPATWPPASTPPPATSTWRRSVRRATRSWTSSWPRCRTRWAARRSSTPRATSPTCSRWYRRTVATSSEWLCNSAATTEPAARSNAQWFILALRRSVEFLMLVASWIQLLHVPLKSNYKLTSTDRFVHLFNWICFSGCHHFLVERFLCSAVTSRKRDCYWSLCVKPTRNIPQVRDGPLPPPTLMSHPQHTPGGGQSTATPYPWFKSSMTTSTTINRQITMWTLYTATQSYSEDWQIDLLLFCTLLLLFCTLLLFFNISNWRS